MTKNNKHHKWVACCHNPEEVQKQSRFVLTSGTRSLFANIIQPNRCKMQGVCFILSYFFVGHRRVELSACEIVGDLEPPTSSRAWTQTVGPFCKPQFEVLNLSKLSNIFKFQSRPEEYFFGKEFVNFYGKKVAFNRSTEP